MQYVLVDDYIPCSPARAVGLPVNSTGLYPVFAHSDSDGEMWVSLIEKMCAKLLGGQLQKLLWLLNLLLEIAWTK
jgi:hypothetical protein